MGRAMPIAVAAVVSAVLVGVLSPRLGHLFPSMVDDWYAILRSPDQLVEVLRLRNPESERYRPGWIAWNALQWHTLGAPGSLRGPQAWGLVRALALVLGLVAAGVVVAGKAPGGRLGRASRNILVGGAVLSVVTIPAFAIDLARFGPQEPLMVGLMCGGGALVTVSIARALDNTRSTPAVLALGGAGALLWAAGVTQKETSICVIALVPFLWFASREQREALARRPTAMRRTVAGILIATALPVALMLVRAVQLTLQPDRVYDAEPGDGLVRKTLDQLREMGAVLGTRTSAILLAVAVVLVVALAVWRRLDLIASGLLVAGLAFLVFAGQTNVPVSRYYLPTLALVALTVVRAVTLLSSVRASLLTAVGLSVLGLAQAPDARNAVYGWVADERAQEELVRTVAAIEAGGCEVTVTGDDVELVKALPVLVDIADEPPHGCTPGFPFVAVMRWHAGEDPDDPAVARCGANAKVVLENEIGRLLRCEPPAR